MGTVLKWMFIVFPHKNPKNPFVCRYVLKESGITPFRMGVETEKSYCSRNRPGFLGFKVKK